MASQPGMLYEFPWEPLGNFKYVILAPFVAAAALGYDDADSWAWHMCCIAVLRYAHAQIWNTLARLHAISAKNKIYGKGIDFKQVDRETHWDDYILLQVVVMTIVHRLPHLGYGGWPLMNWVRPACAPHAAPALPATGVEATGCERTWPACEL